MPADWEDVLLAYLHDPPDKALDIRGHVSRACRYAGEVLGRPVGPPDFGKHADHVGSAVERLPMPTAGEDGGRAVGPVGDQLTVVHPQSGAARVLSVGTLDEEVVRESIREVVRGLEAPGARFLALWRLWPERLARRAPWYLRLPADTRLPDHTIWNHLDTVAGLQPALAGRGGAAFLSFSLGPVQTFIAGARTVRDLWTGSYLLAWLTFQAMRPVLDAFGPAAFVFPALRGSPLMDLYLREPGRGLTQPDAPGADRLLSPCLPNRFTAVVPCGEQASEARELARACEERCRQGWKELCDAVRDNLRREVERRRVRHAGGWDRLWDGQVDSFFEVRTAVLPWRECDDRVLARLLATGGRLADALPDAARVRALERAIPESERPGYPQNTAGMWMGRMELLGRLTDAARGVRHVPPYRPVGEVPQKCSLLGSYEQMGPARLEESREFWDDWARGVRLRGARTRPNERLCAVSLVKRFAWPAWFVTRLGLPADELRFDDTATVAAALWLREGEPALNPGRARREYHDWSGQWLHWSRPNQGDDGDEPVPAALWEAIRAKKLQQGPAPTYYAVLMMDGDHMGRWLRGEKSPPVGRCLHPRLRDYFAALPGTEEALGARRPVTPALHAAISEALANFALHFVPPVVEGDAHRRHPDLRGRRRRAGPVTGANGAGVRPAPGGNVPPGLGPRRRGPRAPAHGRRGDRQRRPGCGALQGGPALRPGPGTGGGETVQGRPP
jgi:CRISPR-associated protein Cmr2